jgi:predicted outer membrane protein
MRNHHRSTRVGAHRPDPGEFSGARTRRSKPRRGRGRGRLWPLVALVAVGLVTVWMATGFKPDASSTDLSLADASAATNPTPVVDSSSGSAEPSTGADDQDDDGNNGSTNTRFGPVTAADKDFIQKVRLAGAWEGPAGRKAQEKAGSQRVKDVGLQLMADHGQLDQKAEALAAQLGFEITDEPNADQQKWLDEMDDAAPGEEFDQVFADRLRAAHGKVFSLVAAIRAGTKNGLVRAFAQTANAAVLKHMTILEGTGVVDFSKLPDAPPPSATGAAPTGSNSSAQPSTGDQQTVPSPGATLGAQDPPPLGQGTSAGNQDQSQGLAPASSKKPSKGFENYIIVIMLGVAGIVSAVAYRQLHRPR